MGGDKKPSAEFFQSGHGKTVLAEAFLSDEQIRRVLRTTAEDLEALSWAGTHGAVASGMQSVAFTPASAIAAIFAATGQDLGMVGTSSMAHGTARRVEGGLQATIRFGGLEVGTVGGGTTLPSARDWLASIGCAGSGQGLPLRADRRRGGAVRSRSAPRPRWRRPAARTSSRRTTSAAACVDRARLPLRGARHRELRGGLRPRRRVGAVLPAGRRLHRHRAAARRRGARALPRDRPLGVGGAYNAFLAEHQAEYLRRSDESRFHYIQELRFGTFENVWP